MSETTFIIAGVLKKNPLEIEANKDKRIVDFGGDSLTDVEIAMALEDYYGIEISDHALERLKTPRDFERAVRNSPRRKKWNT